MENEQRKNKRLLVDDYSVRFNENNLSYTGTVENISLTGLRVKLCPHKSKLVQENAVAWGQVFLPHSTAEYKLIFSTDPGNDRYILAACPRWQAKEGDETRIGFHITRYSEDWRHFVLHILPIRSLLHANIIPGLPAQENVPSTFAALGDIITERKYCKEKIKKFAEIASRYAYDSMQVCYP